MRLFLALGSNLGDRLAHLRFAREEIARSLATGPIQSASLYESAPVDCPAGSPPFLNTVIAAETPLSPGDLLALTQAIESAAGRSRIATRNAPRPLDLDLLLLGDLILHTSDLTIPHPRLHLRRFVLAPLAEIAPDLLVPGQGATVSQLYSSCAGAEHPPLKLSCFW